MLPAVCSAGLQIWYGEFPDLSGVLGFKFGEVGRIMCAGEELESHPHLTDTVLYF